MQKYSLKDSQIISTSWTAGQYKTINGKNLKNVDFYLANDPARDVSLLHINKTLLDGTKTSFCCVVPKIPANDKASLGIFDGDKLLAVLYSAEPGNELGVVDSSGEPLNTAEAQREYITKICNILENNEYPLGLLELEGEEYVYNPDSSWKKSLKSNSLCKNNDNKVAAYKNFEQDIKDRNDWNTLNIYDELDNDISFRDDVHAGKTIMYWSNTSLENDTVTFYLEFPLLSAKDGIVAEAKDGILFLLSRGEKKNIKVNSLCKGDKKQLQDLYYGFQRHSENKYQCRVRSSKLSDAGGSIVMTSEIKEVYFQKEPSRNKELDKFASNFTNFVKKNYFTYDGDYMSKTLPEIVSSYKNLPANEKMFDILKEAGFITVKKCSERTYPQFWHDLLHTIHQFLCGKPSLGKLVGDGIINFTYPFDTQKFDNLMKLEQNSLQRMGI